MLAISPLLLETRSRQEQSKQTLELLCWENQQEPCCIWSALGNTAIHPQDMEPSCTSALL